MNNLEERLTKYYDYLTLQGYCLGESLDMILSINGDNEETYKDVLYYLTGQRNFEDMEDF